MTDKYIDTSMLGQFDGSTEQWQEFDANIDSFNDTLPDDYDKTLRMKEPDKRDRVTTRYTAPEEEDEEYEGPDPTGALPGESVTSETIAQKAAKQRDYVKKVRKLFAWTPKPCQYFDNWNAGSQHDAKFVHNCGRGWVGRFQKMGESEPL